MHAEIRSHASSSDVVTLILYEMIDPDAMGALHWMLRRRSFITISPPKGWLAHSIALAQLSGWSRD